MNLCTCLLAASVFLFSACPLASWEMDDLLTMHDHSVSNPKEEAGFKELKAAVKEQLAGSWCSKEKTDLLMDVVYITRPAVCVEIGAFTGSSVLPVAAALQYLGKGKIYAIDAWSNEEAVRYLDLDDPNRNWWSTVDLQVVRTLFDSLIQQWNLKDVCIPICAPSSQAHNELPEIDFLHLDGNFSEEGSYQDIVQYLPKVKQGGYILLSNVYHTVKNKQPKFKAFAYLFETCEFVSDVDKDNTVLFRKL